MAWLLLFEFLGLHLLASIVIVALIARFRSNWMRWVAWLVAFSPSVGIASWSLIDISNAEFGHFGTLPTGRFYLLGACSGLLVFPVAAGLIGLLMHRAGSDRCRAESWAVGRLMLWTCIGIGVLMGTLVGQDLLIRRQLHNTSKSAFEKACPSLGDSPPPDENGYTLYCRAAALAEQQKDKLALLVGDGSLAVVLPAEARTPWIKFLDANRQIDDLCDRAAACAKYLPVSQLGKAEEDTSDLSQWRSLGEYLLAEGQFHLSAENSTEGYRTVARLRRLAEAQARDGRYIHVIAAASMEDRCFHLLERAINTRPPTPQEYETLKRTSVSYTSALDRAVDWCEAEHLQRLQSIYLGETEAPFQEAPNPNSPIRWLSLAYVRFWYAQDDVLSAQDHYAWWREYSGQEFAATFALGHGRDDPFPGGGRGVGRRGGKLLLLLLPAVRLSMDSMARAEAMRRLEDYALDLTQGLEALDANRIAERKQQVIAPVDPYDGKALRAVRATDGFVVYCVSGDLKDHLGNEGTREEGGFDLVLCLGSSYQSRRLKHPPQP